MRFHTALFFLLFSSSLAASPSIFEPTVIYGEDNRQDISNAKDNNHVLWARGTVAMIKKQSIKESDDGRFYVDSTILKNRNLGRGKTICADEPFADQPTAASCSGFFVGDKKIVTAGHCVDSQRRCDDYKWVWGFNDLSDQEVLPDGKVRVYFDAKNVVDCKKVIASEEIYFGADYAVLEVTGRPEGAEVLSVRREGKIKKDEGLVVIGHPTGLPTKIADGAFVRSNEKDAFFQANLDTYGGNSGSAVLNQETGEVEGILVRGARDYRYSSSKGCYESIKCSDTGCRGEDVTRISFTLPYL